MEQNEDAWLLPKENPIMQKSLVTQTMVTDIPHEECTVWILAPEANETGHYVMHKTRDWGDGEEISVNLFFSRFPHGKYKVLAFSPCRDYNIPEKAAEDLGLLCVPFYHFAPYSSRNKLLRTGYGV